MPALTVISVNRREYRRMSRGDVGQTTVAVEKFLHELAQAEDSSADPIVRALLSRSVRRLHVLCASLLHRGYPRLAQPPVNLEAEELVSAVVGRLIKALESVRPRTVRQFFALANQHMRWELNDLARKLDRGIALQNHEQALVAAPDNSDSGLSQSAQRIMEAIEGLPEELREVFDLVRIQGISQVEAADILGASLKTIQRRLNRGLILLEESLADLRPGAERQGSIDGSAVREDLP